MFIAVKIEEVIVTFCCRVLVLNGRHSFNTWTALAKYGLMRIFWKTETAKYSKVICSHLVER